MDARETQHKAERVGDTGGSGGGGSPGGASSSGGAGSSGGASGSDGAGSSGGASGSDGASGSGGASGSDGASGSGGASSPSGAAVTPRGRRAAAWAAGLLIAGTGVVVGCRAADVDGITPVPQLLAFLPWLLVPTGLALLLGGWARRPVLIALALVLAAVNGWFLRPYRNLSGGPDAPRGPVVAQLRVLTANVEFGGATHQLIDAVRREKPDLLFVQECDRLCSAALARELPAASYPYRNVMAASGAEGSAILSTHPLRPTPGIRSTLAMPGAVAEIGGRQVRLQLAHPLPPVPRFVERWESELAAIGAYVAGGGGPTIVAGDFNASQDHAAFRRILDAGAGLRDGAALAGASRTPTWPAKTAPPLGAQIDHVLVGEEFGVRGARFLDLTGTDHRALLVELELHGG